MKLSEKQNIALNVLFENRQWINPVSIGMSWQPFSALCRKGLAITKSGDYKSPVYYKISQEGFNFLNQISNVRLVKE